MGTEVAFIQGMDFILFNNVINASVYLSSDFFFAANDYIWPEKSLFMWRVIKFLRRNVFFEQRNFFSARSDISIVQENECFRSERCSKEYIGADGGKMAHYLLRWRMRYGSTTAWGETVRATITA